MSQFFMKYAVLFWGPLLAFLISSLLTRALIPWLCHHGFGAETGGRHIHKKFIPAGGGIAMIVALVLTTAAMCWCFPESKRFLGLRYLIPLAILAPVGIYDDRCDMRAFHKLLAQIAACALAWWLGVRLNGIAGWELPWFVSLPLTVFWLLLFINAFNLIDGLDGLAAGLGCISSLILATLMLLNANYSAAAITLALAGACVGFLCYNFHPARVFMGDTGSMYLGYVIGAVGIITSQLGTSFFSLLLPLMACGVPLIDTSLAIWRRTTVKLQSRRSWNEIMSADRLHVHHRLLDQTKSQTKTAIIIYGIALLFGGAGLLGMILMNYLPVLAFLVVLLVLLAVLRKLAVIEVTNSARLIFRGLALPRRSILANILHPVYDLLILFLAFALISKLYNPGREMAYYWEMGLVCAIPVILLLHISRMYRTYWLRAGTPDHFRLFNLISLGFLIDLALYLLANRFFGREWPLRVLFPTYLLAVIGIVGERIALHWLQLVLPRYWGDSVFNHDAVPTLLVGAGTLLSSYQRYLNGTDFSNKVRIVGLVDHDHALHGSYVYGYQIFGDLDALQWVWEHHRFAQIVVVIAKLCDEDRKKLQDFCKSHDVRLLYFKVSVEPAA